MAVHRAADSTIDILEAQRAQLKQAGRLPQVFPENPKACDRASKSLLVRVYVNVNLQRDRVRVRVTDGTITARTELGEASRRGAMLVTSSAWVAPHSDYERFIQAALREQVASATSEYWTRYLGEGLSR